MGLRELLAHVGIDVGGKTITVAGREVVDIGMPAPTGPRCERCLEPIVCTGERLDGSAIWMHAPGSNPSPCPRACHPDGDGPATPPHITAMARRDAELMLYGETLAGVQVACPRCGLRLTAILCRNVRQPEGTDWAILVEVLSNDGTGAITGLITREHDLAQCERT